MGVKMGVNRLNAVNIRRYDTHDQLPFNFSMHNCSQNGDRVQFRFHMMYHKTLKAKTVLY